MRKSIAVGLLLVVVAAGCGGSSTPQVLPKLPGPPPTSKSFRDPGGAYTITISPAWVATGPIVQKIQSWWIAGDRNGFTDNVSVLTAPVNKMDLLQYLGYSRQHLHNLHYIGTSTTTGLHGHRLGLLEYHGKGSGPEPNLELHFLQTIDVRNGKAVVVTLATLDTTFASERAKTEPYLRTIENTA